MYIAMSLDGFIAGENDDLEFLSLVEREGEDYGYGDFIETVETVILGRKTYDKVLSMGEFHHSKRETYVITRTPRPDEGNIRFYTDDLHCLISKLKAGSGGTVFVDGGAEIVNLLMKEKLFDEFIISIIPVFLGKGTALFEEGRPSESLELRSSKAFSSGLVQVHYVRLDK